MLSALSFESSFLNPGIPYRAFTERAFGTFLEATQKNTPPLAFLNSCDKKSSRSFVIFAAEKIHRKGAVNAEIKG